MFSNELVEIADSTLCWAAGGLMNFPGRRAASMALTVAFLTMISGCAREKATEDQQNQREITVAAAANLTDSFAEVAKAFTADTGIRVTFSFGGTADLAKQIENGAPFDIFASADVANVDRLDRQGLLTPGTRALYARGRLVLWIPPGSNVQISSLEDIVHADVDRIGIAKPDIAPYGRAAVESLNSLGLWSQVQPKVVYGENVMQVKQYAATGNVEAAFIPLSLVKPNEGRYIEVVDRLHPPIDQAIGVVKASSKQQAARQFVTFILSDKGQAILERYGYQRPPALVM
jgi:molybdate transport system substrate-binding protein